MSFKILYYMYMVYVDRIYIEYVNMFDWEEGEINFQYQGILCLEFVIWSLR